MIWITTKSGGRGNCKYYKVCGNTENCKRCDTFEKVEKPSRKKSGADRRALFIARVKKCLGIVSPSALSKGYLYKYDELKAEEAQDG
jgi:hypothetical protein